MSDNAKELDLHVVSGEIFANSFEGEVDTNGNKGEVRACTPLGNGNSTLPSVIVEGKPYVLDICLDYFCCKNPFLLDVERKWGLELASALYYYATGAAFRQSRDPVDTCAVEAFNTELKCVLEAVQSGGSVSIERSTRDSSCEESSTHVKRKMALVTAFNALPTASARTQAAMEVLKMLDVLVLPDSDLHGLQRASSPQCPPCPEKPPEKNTAFNYTTSWDEGLQSAKLEAMLVKMTGQHVPTAVTIARSVIDEFCPEDICDKCQKMCLRVLRKVWPGEIFDVNLDYQEKDDD